MKREVLVSGMILALVVICANDVKARLVEVTPTTNNSTLTLNTDGSYGYEVSARKPMKLKVIGPGNLKVTVRLNQKRKRATYKGQLVVSRDGKTVKQTGLRLHRSRVGFYREKRRLSLSVPKVVNIRVPRGMHVYKFSLKAARGTTMTVSLAYNTKVDQSSARDDDLALVSLVLDKPKKPKVKKTQSGEPELIALVPLVPKNKPKVKKPKKDSVKRPKVVSDPVVKRIPLPPKPRVVENKVAEKKDVQEEIVGLDLDVEEDSDPKSISKVVTPPARDMFSVGVKTGQTVSFGIGGPNYLVALDLRYILPALENRFELCLEAGYYQYAVDIQGQNEEVSLQVIPVSLQVLYHLPFDMLLQPVIGLGGDVLINSGEHRRSDNDYVISTVSGKITFAAHVVGGLELELGPGFVTAEVRYGYSFGEAAIWGSSANISGLSTSLGYRFVF
jgi:hypothetical protein